MRILEDDGYYGRSEKANLMGEYIDTFLRETRITVNGYIYKKFNPTNTDPYTDCGFLDDLMDGKIPDIGFSVSDLADKAVNSESKQVSRYASDDLREHMFEMREYMVRNYTDDAINGDSPRLFMVSVDGFTSIVNEPYAREYNRRFGEIEGQDVHLELGHEYYILSDNFYSAPYAKWFDSIDDVVDCLDRDIRLRGERRNG